MSENHPVLDGQRKAPMMMMMIILFTGCLLYLTEKDKNNEKDDTTVNPHRPTGISQSDKVVLQVRRQSLKSEGGREGYRGRHSPSLSLRNAVREASSTKESS